LQFTRDPVSAVTIRHVDRGRIHIGNEDFDHSIAVTSETVLRDWPEIGVDNLNIDDLQDILSLNPDVLILGTGWQPVFPHRDLTFAMARRGIGFEVMDTPAACRTFNVLIAEGRKPAAVLIID